MKSFIFDWDNTLIDSRFALQAGMQAVLDSGFTLPPYEEAKEYYGRSFREGFPKIFGENWQQARTIYDEVFRVERGDGFTPLVGAEEVLQNLYDADYKLFIISNRDHRFLHEEVENLGWGAFFAGICGSGPAEADKPDPQHAHHVLAQAGLKLQDNLSPEAVTMVGDSHVDVRLAHHLGIGAILLLHQEFPTDEKLIEDCHYQKVTQLREILSFL